MQGLGQPRSLNSLAAFAQVSPAIFEKPGRAAQHRDHPLQQRSDGFTGPCRRYRYRHTVNVVQRGRTGVERMMADIQRLHRENLACPQGDADIEQPEATIGKPITHTPTPSTRHRTHLLHTADR